MLRKRIKMAADRSPPKISGLIAGILITVFILSVSTFQGVALESSRPPTNHRRRQGWQESESPRPGSRSPTARDEGWRGRTERSLSDRMTESRSVRWQEEEGEASVPGTSMESRRSVRWQQDGRSPADSMAIPRSSRSSYRQYPDSETIYTPTRRSWVYSSLSHLARIHRKKKEVAPLIDSVDMSEEGRRRLRRPSDMDDNDWGRLLEELYPDKKYLDYAKITSVDLPDEEEYLHEKARQGLRYLYGRAKFWATQEPLVRPGTNMTVRSYTSTTTSSTTSKETPGPDKDKNAKPNGK